MAKDVLQEVKERMADMIATKQAELDEIQKRQAEARTQIEAADLAMRAATEIMDADAYGAAQVKKYKAQTALEMYSRRYSQIEMREFISEEESDKVLDSLLAYEDDLAEAFKAGVAEPLKALDKLYTAYYTAVRDTERTMSAWQQDIHANYSTRGCMQRTDETGAITDRNETPVPVRRTPFYGCAEASQLGDYLKKAKAADLYGGNDAEA